MYFSLLQDFLQFSFTSLFYESSTCKFPIHVYHRAMKNKCLKELYFQLNIMMKLKDSGQLEYYENLLLNKGKRPKYVKLSLFSKRYKFVFFCRIIIL